MTTMPDFSVVLARMEVKLDQLIEHSGDHEARLRKLEDASTAATKQWPTVLTNTLMTAITAALAGANVLG